MSATPRSVFRAFAPALVFIAGAAGLAGATAPNVLTYQGRLKESGLPVTGSRSVDIWLCPDDTTLGDSLCSDTGPQNVSVVNGLFRTTFTVPPGLALETGNWFIEVHVGGATFAPREMLSASPYAVVSSSATTLIANPGSSFVFISTNINVGGSAFVVNGGNVGIGTSSPTSLLEVNGTAMIDGLLILGNRIRVTGSGTPTLGNCTGTVDGNDSVGRVTLSTGAACLLTFAHPWIGSVPVCHFSDDTTGGIVVNATAATDNNVGVTFNVPPAFMSGDVISYICINY